jgi:predicted enzyme related to lactoylglutathione lyase
VPSKFTNERPGITPVLDGDDIERLAEFWSAALGYGARPPVGERLEFIVLRPADPDDTRPHLILQRVPEGKTVKNRMHLDVHVPDREGVRDRLVSLGARQIQEQPNCLGEHCWFLMADPEGNEFCLTDW